MILRLNKWGNSLGLRIPSHFANRFKMVNGTSVSVEATEEGLLIKPVVNELTLEYLLEGIGTQAVHPDYFESI